MTELNTVRRIGHWPLRTDCNDKTINGRHGESQGIQFDDGAVFDGLTSSITIPHIEETDGSKPFTLSLEFKIEDDGGVLPGGLCNQFDDASQSGWHLSILTQAGVTFSQANWRNLQFGWSTGQANDEWQDWGSPGNCRNIFSMCVHDGHLYTGTFDDAENSLGRVYRLGKDGDWVNCGNPDNSNCVSALAEFNGRLYAGTMCYKAVGSAMEESPNQEPGGCIYRYEGGQSWSLFAKIPGGGAGSVGTMAVYRNKLVASAFYTYGIYAFSADGDCEQLDAPGPEGTTRTFTLAPYQGELYVGCNVDTGVYSRTLETPWAYRGNAANSNQVYCFSVYRNELLAGIWPQAKMVRYEGGIAWREMGLMGAEKEVMGVSVFNGRLYGGTLPGGHVYRYAGNSQWELVGILEAPDPAVLYRRVWSMAVYEGQLFAGTMPSGKVWSLKNDPLATCDSGVSDGWHRVTATYNLEKLSLYLDGQFVSSSECPEAGLSRLAHIPLVLGNGPQCRFAGRMREVELFDVALSDEQVKEGWER